jgi:hypothetical protein
MGSAGAESRKSRDHFVRTKTLRLTLLGIARLVFQDSLGEAANSVDVGFIVWGVSVVEDFLTQRHRQVREECEFCQGLVRSCDCYHCERLRHHVVM